MELSKQIKKYRGDMNLSQEELAEKIYVTRQTISNWETGKNYPDIHSLLLLSSVFDVSLDQLIKGDIEIMKEEIKETELKEFIHYGNIFSVLFFVSIISFAPMLLCLQLKGVIAWAVLYVITLIYSFKVEKLKKKNNVHTYKEIVAFMDGKRLDEIETQVEAGKRPYQTVLLVLGSACFTFLVSVLLVTFLKWLLK